MTTPSGTPAPLETADAADLAEQARGLAEDDPAPELEPPAWETDPADALDQQREIGWDEEHETTG